MISIFAIVEINGCILNLAMKKPAIMENTVVKITHINNASNAFAVGAIAEKSNTCPNTAPVLIPLCMMMVAVTIPIPTIRPTERSVPVKRINPATPRARNILGEACCRMLSMFVYVSNCVFFTIGVTAHNPINIRTITIYKPFL